MPSLRLMSLNVMILLNVTVSHHNVADDSNQSDCIIKNPHSEMQEKESIMGVRDRQKNLSHGITVWYHSASLMMPDSDPRDGFLYLHLIPMIDSYITWITLSFRAMHYVLNIFYFSITIFI